MDYPDEHSPFVGASSTKASVFRLLTRHVSSRAKQYPCPVPGAVLAKVYDRNQGVQL